MSEAIAGAGFGGWAGGGWRPWPVCRGWCLVVQRVEGAGEGEGIERVARHAAAASPASPAPLAAKSMTDALQFPVTEWEIKEIFTIFNPSREIHGQFSDRHRHRHRPPTH